MAPGATSPDSNDLEQLRSVLAAIAAGDFCHKLPEGQPGTMGEIARTVNTLVDDLNRFASELTRISRELGSEARLGGQMEVPGSQGSWKDLCDNVNFCAANLTNQLRNFSEVTRYYADGDFSKRATVGCAGEVAGLKDEINRLGERMETAGG
jgi:HAMP domain-containing protein